MRSTVAEHPGAPAAGKTSVVVTGVADCKVTSDPNAHLVTYALGSCLGITFHDRHHRIGGLLHVMLPDSSLHRGANLRKEMFVDTGVPLILEAMVQAGASRANLHCKVFGGAQTMSADKFFRIGSKNIEAFTALSRALGLNVVAWEVSGCVNRTIRLVNNTGEVLVKTPAKADFVI